MECTSSLFGKCIFKSKWRESSSVDDGLRKHHLGGTWLTERGQRVTWSYVVNHLVIIAISTITKCFPRTGEIILCFITGDDDFGCKSLGNLGGWWRIRLENWRYREFAFMWSCQDQGTVQIMKGGQSLYDPGFGGEITLNDPWGALWVQQPQNNVWKDIRRDSLLLIWKNQCWRREKMSIKDKNVSFWGVDSHCFMKEHNNLFLMLYLSTFRTYWFLPLPVIILPSLKSVTREGIMLLSYFLKARIFWVFY